jgi:hypothetical protein
MTDEKFDETYRNKLSSDDQAKYDIIVKNLMTVLDDYQLWLKQRKGYVDLSSFIDEFKKLYPKQYKPIIKQFLFSRGVNCYSRSYGSAKKFLARAMDLKIFDLEQLATNPKLDFKIKQNKIRKQPASLESLKDEKE